MPYAIPRKIQTVDNKGWKNFLATNSKSSKFSFFSTKPTHFNNVNGINNDDNEFIFYFCYVTSSLE